MKRFRANSKKGLSGIALAGYAMALLILAVAALFKSQSRHSGTDNSTNNSQRAAIGSASNMKEPATMRADTSSPENSEPARDASTAKAVINYASLADFLADLRKAAVAKNISGKIFDQAFASFQLDADIIEFTKRQPEHDRTPWDYVSGLVSPERIAEGRDKLVEHANLLRRIETAYGIDQHIIIALWGIETSYGSGQGKRNILRSLATLAFQDKRRSAFWKKQLLAALRIVAAGDISASNIGGSWAGAMGHTQFMPTTYLSHAVDFDGDGKRDIWNSIPDALASAANYLKASGWVRGQPWGFEVSLPQEFDYALSAPGNAQSITNWLALGVGAIKGQKLPAGAGSLELLLPAGAAGPAFLVSSNFKAILKYNNSTLYALSAGLLATRLAGGPDIAKPWPTHVKPLARLQRQELQQLLVNRGLDTGGIDGILGGRSRSAIRRYQLSENLPADGFPTTEILARLRRSATKVTSDKAVGGEK